MYVWGIEMDKRLILALWFVGVLGSGLGFGYNQGAGYLRGNVVSLVTDIPKGGCDDGNIIILRQPIGSLLAGTLSVCLGNTFVPVGQTVPTGAIIFTISTCPLGFSQVKELHGRLVGGSLDMTACQKD